MSAITYLGPLSKYPRQRPPKVRDYAGNEKRRWLAALNDAESLKIFDSYQPPRSYGLLNALAWAFVISSVASYALIIFEATP